MIELDFIQLGDPRGRRHDCLEVTTRNLVTDDNENVSLVEILFGLVVNLAVQPQNICVEFVGAVTNATSVDSGAFGVKQVAVDVVSQLGRQWKVGSRAHVLHVVCVGRGSGVQIVCGLFLYYWMYASRVDWCGMHCCDVLRSHVECLVRSRGGLLWAVFMSCGPRASAADRSRISTTARAGLRRVACDFGGLIELVS